MHYAIMYEKAFIMIVQIEIYSRFTKAIQALKQVNPFFYCPEFLDRENVWKLDKNRSKHYGY